MTATLLDGAMGTALIARGLPPSEPPERWLRQRPQEIEAVHAAHRAAGAEVLLTCTFNLASPRAAGAHVGPVDETAALAVSLARRAAAGARVAGAVGPTWDPDADAAALYDAAAAALARAGADLLWFEGLPGADDAALAAAAARRTGLPFALTFGFREERGVLVDAAGCAAARRLALAAESGALAVGSNCSLPGAPLADVLREAARSVRVALVAKPSAGLPGAVVEPAAFAAWAVELAGAGAAYVGGCCGATPAHLAAAAAALR